MGSLPDDVGAWTRAATAANQRAQECRRRVDDLVSGDGWSSGDDVARARDRLERARERAEAAERHLDEVLRTHQERQTLRRAGYPLPCVPPALPARLDEQSAVTPLAAQLLGSLQSGAVPVPELWHTFIGYGGEAPLLEFDAFLHGAWSMSAHDLHVLEQVWWEREFLDGGTSTDM